MTRITIGSSTDLGKRESNEDSLLAVVSQDSTPRGGKAESIGSSALLILADGMGGRASGQVASRTAVRVVYRELAHVLALRRVSKRDYLEKVLQNSLKQANARIRNLGDGHPIDDGMGTTCTVAVIAQDTVSVAHVGDTRAYILTAGRPLKALTEDHSVVGDEVRAGRLTEAQARRSKFRNVITRAVGVESSVTADIDSYDLPANSVSRLVISSDGLHGTLHEDQIEDVLNCNPDPQEAASELVAAAKDRGASDNISAIVARIETGAIDCDSASAGNGVLNDRERPHRNESPLTLHAWTLIAFGIGVAFATVVACLAMAGVVHRLQSGAGNARRAAPMDSGLKIDLTTATFAAPEPLLGRNVASGVLLRSDTDIFVVDKANRRLLRVNSVSADVITSVPDTERLASSPTRDVYWAADSQGDLYESVSSPAQVRKFGPNGQFLRTIGQGMLTAPSAITIAPDGDVFVIDNGVLKRLRAVPLTGAFATQTQSRQYRNTAD
jgi:protein phosphatase